MTSTQVTPDDRFDRRAALLLFVAALLVRLAWTALFDLGQAVPVGTDAVSYDAFARAILAGTGWITHPGPELFRPPGYPMVLAFQYLLFGGNLGLVQLSQSLVGAASVVLLYRFGLKHAGRWPALLAALWLLVNPLHLDFNGMLLRETWLVLLNLGLLASLLADDGVTHRGLWRTGLLFTLLVHFDSRYIFHLPFLGGYTALRCGSLKSAIRPTAVLVLSVFVLSAPWAIRNAVAYDHLVLVDTRALDRWGQRARTAVAGDAMTREEMMAAFEQKKEARFDSLSAEEQAAWRAGVRPKFGQPHKAIFNMAEFWRIAHFGREYRPFPDTRFGAPWSLEHNISSLLFMGLLLPFFLAGAWRGIVGGDRAVQVMVAFIAAHTLLHVVVHSVTRYRLPVEPFYALIACQELVRRLPRRVAPSAAPKPAPAATGPAA